MSSHKAKLRLHVVRTFIAEILSLGAIDNVNLHSLVELR